MNRKEFIGLFALPFFSVLGGTAKKTEFIKTDDANITGELDACVFSNNTGLLDTTTITLVDYLKPRVELNNENTALKNLLETSIERYDKLDKKYKLLDDAVVVHHLKPPNHPKSPTRV